MSVAQLLMQASLDAKLLSTLTVAGLPMVVALFQVKIQLKSIDLLHITPDTSPSL